MKLKQNELNTLKYLNLAKDLEQLAKYTKTNKIHAQNTVITLCRKGMITKGKATYILGIDNPCLKLLSIPLRTNLNKPLKTINEKIMTQTN